MCQWSSHCCFSLQACWNKPIAVAFSSKESIQHPGRQLLIAGLCVVLAKIFKAIFTEESPEGYGGVRILQAILLNCWKEKKKFWQQSDSLYYTYACNWVSASCVRSLENSSHIETAKERKRAGLWKKGNKYRLVCVALYKCYKQMLRLHHFQNIVQHVVYRNDLLCEKGN